MVEYTFIIPAILGGGAVAALMAWKFKKHCAP